MFAFINIIRTNLIFFIPMVLVGMVLLGEVPVASKLVHGGLEMVGAVVGAVLAIWLLIEIPILMG